MSLHEESRPPTLQTLSPWSSKSKTTSRRRPNIYHGTSRQECTTCPDKSRDFGENILMIKVSTLKTGVLG